MDIRDNTEFRNRLVALSELFDVKLPPQRQALYFEALRDLPFEAVAGALNQAARGCTWFPKPAELRTFAVGDAEDHAEAAWMLVRQAMTSAGAYASLAVSDPALGEAILAVFQSWPAACHLDLTPEMWASKRKEWGRVYRALRSRALTGGRYLAGLCEQQNAGKRDWAKFVPVFLLEGIDVRALSLPEAEERRQLMAATTGFSRLEAGTLATLIPRTMPESA